MHWVSKTVIASQSAEQSFPTSEVLSSKPFWPIKTMNGNFKSFWTSKIYQIFHFSSEPVGNRSDPHRLTLLSVVPGVHDATILVSHSTRNYNIVFKWVIPGLYFFIFVFSTQLTVNKCLMKVCRWLDSNRGSLVLQVTTLPTEPQQLPQW